MALDMAPAMASGRAFIECRDRNMRQVDERLVALFATLEADTEPTLLAGMRYAVLGAGQRLRPLLVRLCAGLVGNESDELSDANKVWSIALAVELIHAYSLVHDDLPALDDDCERRGAPSLHVKFGEDIAILVGDALQALAFEVLADSGDVELLRFLAVRAGARWLVGGQSEELVARNAGRALAKEDAMRVIRGKTAALFVFSCEAAVRQHGVPAKLCKQFADFGFALGVTYQLLDDLRDKEAASDSLTLKESLSSLEQMLKSLPDGGGQLANLPAYFSSLVFGSQ